MFLRYALFLCAVVGLQQSSLGQEEAAEAESSPKKKPTIHALLVTGGCCHDYDRQKLILTRGVSARADVRWTVVQQGGKTTNTPIPLYNDPEWAKGFDIVVHNECFSHVTDLAFVDRILHPHREGTPAILIHCAMHCYRVKDDRWFRFVGLQSPGHGPHYSYTVENLQPKHPIMQGFGEQFVAPKGELYHSVQVFETATPLGQAKRKSDGKPQVCIWTNDYQGTRVFGTTIGHYNETMAEPKYLDMLTKGLLWAVRRDTEADFRKTTTAVDQQIKELLAVPVAPNLEGKLPQRCCGDGNLASTAKVSASSEEKNKNNFAKHAIDGDLTTRWCANGNAAGEFLHLDLGAPQEIRSLRIHWEKDQAAYRYVVEGSLDGSQWQTLVDASKNRKKKRVVPHKINPVTVRHLRVKFLGADQGYWGSIWEVEAYASAELPELPKGVARAVPAQGGRARQQDVQAPDGFQVTLFGTPPEVNYPVCLTAAATGEVFVGVDEQGSLGKEPGRGKVLRCIDTDGDGAADRINTFVKVDHPRGLVFDNGSLWVLHPPNLTVFHDHDKDGVADASEVLVEGISTEEVQRRGADHTTNGIRMGVDGWIYIAVGDFGFHKAVAKDGTTLSKRGGGVVRIRPDGTQMEVFAWGLRNIVDVAIDPYLNVFTRDNTNDGGGWDIRLSHILQTANYGYPSQYRNFTGEIMPPLADYGGGSGCGAMFFQDARWPEGFNHLLLTCDWGRSEVFRHNLPAQGATFDAQQSTFLKLPRPTDIDADASGRMYVSSWKNGKFNYGGPNVGFVAQVTPVDFVPKPIPDVATSSLDSLVALLAHPSAAMRLHVQREIARRAESLQTSDRLLGLLQRLIADDSAPLFARIAAIFTAKESFGSLANSHLAAWSADGAIREACLRAMADRMDAMEGVDAALFLRAANDPNPRVRAAAIVGLARLHRKLQGDKPNDGNTVALGARSKEFATAILPHTRRDSPAEPSEGDAWRAADPGRVIPHLAVKALVDMQAVDACCEALDGSYRDGALQTLQAIHIPQTVDRLFTVLGSSRDSALRQALWTTLIRLYHREGEFTESSPGWWGTRPDTSGPYYHRTTWSESERIGAALKIALAEPGAEQETAHIREQLKRHRVSIQESPEAKLAAKLAENPIALPPIDPKNKNQIGNLESTLVLNRAMDAKGDPSKGEKLFRAQSCSQCHTVANGQQPKGPHLVDIGKRYQKQELVESIVEPSKKIAQGFDTWAFVTSRGKIYTGFVVQESAETVTIRQTNGLPLSLQQDEIEERVKQEVSMMPKGVVANLTPEQLADLLAYLQTLH